MIDFEQAFCEDKSLAAAITSDPVDFHQAAPNAGGWDERLYALAFFPTKGSGAGTVTFTLQDSADNKTYTDVLSTGPIVGSDLVAPVAIPLPLKHRRYLRVKTALSGTIAGSASIFLADAANLPMDSKVQGIDIVPTVD